MAVINSYHFISTTLAWELWERKVTECLLKASQCNTTQTTRGCRVYNVSSFNLESLIVDKPWSGFILNEEHFLFCCKNKWQEIKLLLRGTIPKRTTRAPLGKHRRRGTFSHHSLANNSGGVPFFGNQLGGVPIIDKQLGRVPFFGNGGAPIIGKQLGRGTFLHHFLVNNREGHQTLTNSWGGVPFLDKQLGRGAISWQTTGERHHFLTNNWGEAPLLDKQWERGTILWQTTGEGLQSLENNQTYLYIINFSKADSTPTYKMLVIVIIRCLGSTWWTSQKVRTVSISIYNE